MNRKFLFFNICLIVVFAFVLILMVGILQEQSVIKTAASQYRKLNQIALNQVVESLKNDLLQGNLRQVRNSLESVKNDILFSSYKIEQHLPEKTQVLSDSLESNFQTGFETKILVSFSENGKLWGVITFYTVDHNYLILKGALESILRVTTLASMLIFLGILWMVVALFWRTSNELTIVIDALINRKNYSLTHLTRKIWLPIILKIEKITEEYASVSEKMRSVQMNDAIVTLASQVAHDVRSPLAALNMVLGFSTELPEEKRLLMRNAIQRINDIANSLLNKNKSSSIEGEVQTESGEDFSTMIIAVLDSIISEKRTQHRDKIDIEIRAELSAGYGLFANIKQSELSRIISNLINNSIEAFEGRGGKIDVEVLGEGELIVIDINDNGKGIPADILSTLGKKGVSYGKDNLESGSGLGLFHAHETLGKVGGEIEIYSELKKGTKVRLRFPKCIPPEWFLQELELRPHQKIVSVDDDITIHQIWFERIVSENPLYKVEHLRFTSLDHFEKWVLENREFETWFLVDYEFLGDARNGLEIIQKLNIQTRTILVTSRFEEYELRRVAKKLKLKILPKGLAPLIPISYEKS